jgi:hypothetical protein
MAEQASPDLHRQPPGINPGRLFVAMGEIFSRIELLQPQVVRKSEESKFQQPLRKKA